MKLKITYAYKCCKCGFFDTLSSRQRYFEPPTKKWCPKCKAETLERQKDKDMLSL